MSTRALRPPPMMLADHLALDFLNTVATPTDAPVEWLANGEDLLDWLKLVGAIDEAVVTRLHSQGGQLDAVADEARQLREWFRGFVKRHAGKKLAPGSLRELEPLNRLLTEDNSFPQVIATARRPSESSGRQPLQWVQQRRWGDPRLLLQPVAEAMGDLVCHADFRLVRACEGAGCTLMFYDRTKGHARRWCSMSVCGNRAKAAAHRARIREERRGPAQ